MTVRETAVLEKLRCELHDYHLIVTQHITACESCRATVSKHELDLYGVEGEKETHPGLLGDVAEQRIKWRTMRTGLRCVWALITLALSALVAFVFGR